MANATPSSVVKLNAVPQERNYTVSVYAVVIAFFAVAAVIAGAYNVALANIPLALGLFAAAVALSVLAWGTWTLQPWRYSYGRVVHLVGLALGLLILVVWFGELAGLITANETVQESGYELGVILRELPRLPVNSLPLADAVLLILLNYALLRTLTAFKRIDAERSIDQTYSNEADLLLQRFLNNSSARIGGILIILMLIIVYVMPRVDPYHGSIVLRDGDLSRRLDPPDCMIGWLRVQQGLDMPPEGAEATSLFDFPCEHPFGFDKNGRDVMRRVLHGIGVSLAVSVIAVSISLFIGSSIGLVAGYIGGTADSVLMRLMDIMLAFPSLLLAIAIVAMRGPGLENGMIAIGIVGIPVYARLARSMAISIRETDFVMATRSLGSTNFRIVRSHILPNSLAPLIVQSTLALGTAVIETAALGFLGLGQQPPFPELGKMLAESREVMTSGKWWVMFFPGIAVMLIVLGFNLAGDALRDTLDPQLRGR